MTDAFEIPIEIQSADIDEFGHVNNIVYLRWVQEVAVAHWKSDCAARRPGESAWVVLRHEIDYRHAARPGDAIVARTWVGGATRLKFERHTEVLRAADRAVLAKALTIWCPIDPRTGKATNVSPEVRAIFSTLES